MPSIFSHAIFAATLGKATLLHRTLSTRFWVMTALCAMLPDADVVGFAVGIPYDSLWGHRGFTHSIVFALLVGVVMAFVVFRDRRSRPLTPAGLVAYFTLVTLSHPLLDAFTSGGLGVALFAPFSGERYFAPWRPIRVSPIGADFFSARGLAVIASELVWIWLPAFALLGLSWFVRKARR
ncbi:inner membrane protein [Catalinimonas alkaloidigena]|uniref:Inner membrane protein n=1 Tax=Catalinimonas alkaloidigena TaxID=1075417 RepID=A0A1G9DHQ0_9BACT|nr:metal-dependent hydrolase [Catalinimonas alkaloidigena]SDK63422.1 inner membrane protein [Catalinimonas alkaloidigena]